MKNSKFLCGRRKGHGPFTTPLRSLYMHIAVMSAHTLLGPFISMLSLEDHTHCFIQLCSSSVIMSLSLCTPVLYGILLLIVHTLCLAQFVVQLNFTYTHLWGTHFAWIGFTAVHLYFSPVSAHSWTVCKTALYNCILGSLT